MSSRNSHSDYDVEGQRQTRPSRTDRSSARARRQERRLREQQQQRQRSQDNDQNENDVATAAAADGLVRGADSTYQGGGGGGGGATAVATILAPLGHSLSSAMRDEQVEEGTSRRNIRSGPTSSQGNTQQPSSQESFRMGSTDDVLGSLSMDDPNGDGNNGVGGGGLGRDGETSIRNISTLQPNNRVSSVMSELTTSTREGSNQDGTDLDQNHQSFQSIGSASAAGTGGTVAYVHRTGRRSQQRRKEGLAIEDDDDEDAPQPGAFFSGPRRGTAVPATPWSPQSILSHAQHATPQQLNLYAEVQLATNRNDSLSSGPTQHDGSFRDEVTMTSSYADNSNRDDVRTHHNKRKRKVRSTKRRKSDQPDEKSHSRWLWLLPCLVLTLLVIGLAVIFQTFFNPGRRNASTGNEPDGPSLVDSVRCTLLLPNFFEGCKNNNAVEDMPPCATPMYDELAFKVLQDSMRDKPESNTFRSAPFPERCSVGHQALVALAAAKVDYPDNGWSDVEYYALASVYVALQGSDWTHRGGWLQPGVGPCTWAGIECNEYDNVASLDLKSNRAEGKIPYQIGLLASLKHLDLSANKLSGSIPEDIQYLTSLESLVFDSIPMSTTIPTEIGSLINLTTLSMVTGKVKGHIPTELGRLTYLRMLAIEGTLSGYIPSELGLLTSLTHLMISAMTTEKLKPRLPSEIGVLSNLVGLELIGMMPGVTIPAEYMHMTNLVHFGIAGDMGGTLPFPEMVAMTNKLEYVRLHSGRLEGTIPTEIGLFTSLKEIVLDDSDLTGPLPSEVGLLTNLEHVSIVGSTLTGTLPTELNNLAKLQRIDLEFSLFSGVFPSTLCHRMRKGQLSVSANFCPEHAVKGQFGVEAQCVEGSCRN